MYDVVKMNPITMYNHDALTEKYLEKKRAGNVSQW